MIDYSHAPRHDYFCIDARSFYASCEMARLGLDPDKTFLVVAGDLKRPGSIILAASPRAKEVYGISTQTRLFQVPKHIHIVEANMEYYLEVSVGITRLLSTFVSMEDIFPYSIDESFLNLTPYRRLYGEPREIAEKLRTAIWQSYGIRVAIGVGDNPFLSKVVMDRYGKKSGYAECRYEDVPRLIWPLEVQSVWGIGEATALKLRRIGIYRMEQLAKAPLSLIRKKFGSVGEMHYWHAWGIDYSNLKNNGGSEAKSFGHSITLLRDYHEKKEILLVVLEITEEVCRRARRANRSGKTIHLYIGYSREEQRRSLSKSFSLSYHTNLTADIYRVCKYIFENHYTGGAVRQVGVSLTNLASDDFLQLDLFKNNEKQLKLDRIIDTIRDKFGFGALLRASSYTKGGIMVKRVNQIGGHKR
ncbi:DinB/UmuC family translesion DNA polymerase [Aneurinibacillus tyrosinisolvens]|uniref:Y-family DNA polymerase n=1 Tax=Aneurinibacillus tyrosinisolvens TaxID=1443435 RepID=UPI00063F54F5|nr:hypothetical protein [Aneurinibacillus tyrosinisolvens]